MNQKLSIAVAFAFFIILSSCFSTKRVVAASPSPSPCTTCHSPAPSSADPAQLLVNIDDLLNDTMSNLQFKFTGPNATLGAIVAEALKFLYGLAGIALLFFLIRCGFAFLTSAGDPKKMEAAKSCLTNSIIGFVLIIVAYWITQILNYVLALGSPLQ